MEWFKERQLKGFTYTVSKFILCVAFVLVMVFAVVSLNYSKFSGKTYYYTECGTNLMTGKCVNVYFESNLCMDGTIASHNLPYGSELCNTEFMYPGQIIGEQPPWLVRNFAMVGSLIVALALLINTFIYNKGFFNYVKRRIKGEVFE